MIREEMETGAFRVMVSGVMVTAPEPPDAEQSKSTTPIPPEVQRRAKPGVPVNTPIPEVMGPAVR
jgi:hypothetical protein